jgi:hypothetical protein
MARHAALIKRLIAETQRQVFLLNKMPGLLTFESFSECPHDKINRRRGDQGQ